MDTTDRRLKTTPDEEEDWIWNVTDDTHCVLCAARDYEDRFHLFFGCTFSQRVWSYLQIDWSLDDDMYSAITAARRSFAKPFFMEVVITACWHIWKTRNGKIFQNERPLFARWKNQFIHDMTLLSHRIKRKHWASLLLWVSNLPQFIILYR